MIEHGVQFLFRRISKQGHETIWWSAFEYVKIRFTLIVSNSISFTSIDETDRLGRIEILVKTCFTSLLFSSQYTILIGSRI